MTDDILTALLLLGAGAFAGVLNAVAGGGSLVTLPLLIFLGLPAGVANATNRIAIFMGALGSTHSFAKRDLIPTGWIKVGLAPSLLGVAVGVWGATRIGDVAFERLLAMILLASAALVVWQPPVLAGERAPSPATGTVKRIWMFAGFLGLGAYSGLVQAGVGFLMTAFLAAQGMDLIRANGVKAALTLLYAGAAIGLFAFTDLLDWGAGLTLALGMFFGGKAGVRLQVLKGQAWVRAVFLVAIVFFSLRLILGG
jgi:uncharacterized membrane protein YfcA